MKTPETKPAASPTAAPETRAAEPLPTADLQTGPARQAPAVPRPPGGGNGDLRRRHALRLQWLVGNQSAQRHLLQRQDAPAAPAPAANQQTSSDIDAERLAKWEQLGGPAMIAAVNADCSSWAQFRRAPTSFRTAPGDTASAAMKTFLSQWPQNDAPLMQWMKFHAGSQVASTNLSYLQEMASLLIGFNPDVGRIFNVARKDVKHEYVVKTHDATTLGEVLVQTFAPAMDMTYKNDLGINWQRKFTVPGVNFALGLSFDPLPGDVEIDPTKPIPVQPSLEKDVPVSPGVSVGRLQIEVDGEVKGRGNVFYGSDDLEGGVQVVSGPAAEFNILDGGNKISAGGAVGFIAPPVPIWFDQWQISTKVSGVNTPARKVAPKGKFQVVGMGGGLAIGSQATYNPPPEYEPQIIGDYRQWMRQWYYETGEWVPAAADGFAAIADELVKMKRAILDLFKQLKIEEDKAYLESKGVTQEQAMAITVQIIGHASRSWQGARSDAQRVRENEALAQRRADTAKPIVESLFSEFPGPVAVTAAGGGPSTPGMSYGNEPIPDLKEGAADATLEYEKEKANQQFDERKQAALLEQDPATRRRLVDQIERERRAELGRLERRFGSQSNEQFSRRTDIIVTWNGKRVAHELPGVPKGTTG